MPECVAIAGWAHDRSCWDPVRAAVSHGVTWRDVTWQELCRDGTGALSEGPAGGSIVAGWSLGGLLALQAAIERPRRVAALVLVGATARFTSDGAYPGTPVREVRALRAQCRRAAPDAFSGFFNRCLAPGQDPREVEQRTQRACSLREEDILRGLDVLGRADLRADVARVTCPVVVVHGDADGVIPVEHGRWLSSRLPNASLAVVRGAGHDLAGALAGEAARAIQALAGRAIPPTGGERE